MQEMAKKQMMDHIRARAPFRAVACDHSFSIQVRAYQPRIGAAIHNGSQLRDTLKTKCALSQYERWHEEDPLTGLFIESLPIQIVGLDSRYEYDLNRSTEDCVYSDAWGKRVWQKPLPESEVRHSLAKHREFFEMLDFLVAEIEAFFGFCVVYDIHSYNWQRNRVKSEVPTFNIGTERIDRKRFAVLIESWLQAISLIECSNENVRAAENEVFFGHGHLLNALTQRFSNTLVLATEIKKIYCDENTGAYFPEAIEELKKGFSSAFRRHRMDIEEHAKSIFGDQVKLGLN